MTKIKIKIDILKKKTINFSKKNLFKKILNKNIYTSFHIDNQLLKNLFKNNNEKK